MATAALSLPSCTGSDSKLMKKTEMNGAVSVPPVGPVSAEGWCS